VPPAVLIAFAGLIQTFFYNSRSDCGDATLARRNSDSQRSHHSPALFPRLEIETVRTDHDLRGGYAKGGQSRRAPRTMRIVATLLAISHPVAPSSFLSAEVSLPMQSLLAHEREAIGQQSLSRASLRCARNDEAATKRKGPQLALEPLNGQGIAGYLPEPKLRRGARERQAPGELSSCRRARRDR
jgi:hypothetical protein